MKRVLFVIVTLSITFGLYFAMSSAKPKASKPKTKAVVKLFQTKAIEATTQSVEIQLRGRILSTQRFEVSPEMPGVIESSGFRLKTGQRVTRGQSLLRVDSRSAQLQAELLKAQLLTTLTTFLPELSQQYPDSLPAWQQYFDDLNSGASATIPKVTDSRLQMLVHRMGVSAQHYQYQQQLVALSKHSLRAPFTGTVIQTSVTEGSRVAPGQILGSFVGLQNYEMQIEIPLGMVEHLKVGSEVMIELEGSDEQIQGRLARVGQAVNARSQTVPGAVKIRAQGKQILDSRYGVATLKSKPLPSTFSLAAEAVMNQDKVLLIEDGKLQEQSAQVLLRSQDSVYLSMEGFQEGQVVVNELFQEFIPGMAAQSRSQEAQP